MVKYYSAAGKRLAMRTGSGGGTTGLLWLAGDHLGSTAIVANADGSFYSSLRYKPWGEIRYANGATPTPYQYTGQRNETAIGLYFYNARWYDYTIGRFVQADTVTPGMWNPGAFDRYSYVLNNPMMYTDPSGHGAYCGDDYDPGCLNNEETLYYLIMAEGQSAAEAWFIEEYQVTFTGDWKAEHKLAVMKAVAKVGQAFAGVLGGEGADAFRNVYGLNDGDTFLFEWDINCWGCRTKPSECDAGTATGTVCDHVFGFTNDENWIEFASMAELDTPLRWINNVIHELGHAFSNRLGGAPANLLDVDFANLRVRDDGFYGPAGNITWQQSRQTTGSEIFADQFLGWTYGLWETHPNSLGPARTDFMTRMNGGYGINWVRQAAGLP